MPPPGRFRGKRILVYHEASNDHVEMYIYDERTGVAHNVGVHVLTAEEAAGIRKNHEGWLTADSKEICKDVFRQKAHNREFVGISTDHRLYEARSSWNRTEHGPSGYGAGPHREVVSEIDIEAYSNGSTIEWVDWELNPHAPIYCHVVFPANEGRSGDVAVIGYRRLPEPVFEDRLHLTMDQDDVDRFVRNVGEDGHASLKIDGASTHFVVNKDGARFFSPRHSKQTGRRIEYTWKCGELQDLTSDEPIYGMGELVFVDTRTGEEFVAHEVAGVLNANRLPDSHIQARVYVYRVDKVGRQNVLDEPYWEANRPRCEALARRSTWMEVPREVSMDDLLSTRDAEGVVGVPAGKPITAGRKLKWREDARDVIVLEVDFHEGPTGKVAGVVWYEDPAVPGKRFKTSSGWTEEEKRTMMADPSEYEGRCMKIKGFAGHGSRAAKFDGWHLDKDEMNSR